MIPFRFTIFTQVTKICAFSTQIIKEVQIERFHQLRNEGSQVHIKWYECQFTTSFLKEIRGIKVNEDDQRYLNKQLDTLRECNKQ